ncbi:MAG TPA: cyclic pyranopterin monophosphate synthase MoaC [Bacteroidales bacterium]|nr:cyclic pyranopterin monophosphate synthase MoaC [Bacteroidales bacterium]
MTNKFSHINNKTGKANMVDVGDKPDSLRIAVATGLIKLSPETVKMIRDNSMKKGEVLSISEFAGIIAAKKTSELIPLCHQLNLTKVDVIAEIKDNGVEITATTKCIGQTGVEMEALTAVSVGLLTIYDMCKAVDKNMIIEEIKLVNKTKSPCK